MVASLYEYKKPMLVTAEQELNSNYPETINSQQKDDLLHEVVTRGENGEPLSYVHSDVWDFSFDRAKGGRIDFTDKRCGKHKRELQLALKKLLDNRPTVSCSRLNSMFSKLVGLAQHIDSTQWHRLDDDKTFRQWLARVLERNISKATLQHYFIVINDLNLLGLTNRFIDKPTKLGEQYGSVGRGQAICLPERMGMLLLAEAVSVVEKYHSYRHCISDSYDYYFTVRDKKLSEGMSSRNFSTWAKKNLQHDIPFDDFTINGWVSDAIDIQTACIIVTLGFSGVRISEGLNMDLHSYIEEKINGVSVPFIKGVTTKSEQGGTPKAALWITHPIVNKAMELAYDMSEFSRRRLRKRFKADSNMLKALDSSFIALKVGNVINGVQTDISGVTKNFKKFCSVHHIVATQDDVKEFDLLNPDRVGSLRVGAAPTDIATHAMRRTFAVFLLRNKLGSISALKGQYKHLNVVMTKWYTNNQELAQAMDFKLDEELLAMVEEANVQITTNAVFDIMNATTLTGQEGKRIVAERDSNGYQGDIYLSREEIERQVRSGMHSIVEHPTGYCFNSSCDRICNNDLSKFTCAHEATTPAKAKERIPARAKLMKKFNKLNNGQYSMIGFLGFLKLRIEAIESTLAEHNLPFIPFKGDILAKSITIQEL
jgi:hypothetical protein